MKGGEDSASAKLPTSYHIHTYRAKNPNPEHGEEKKVEHGKERI